MFRLCDFLRACLFYCPKIKKSKNQSLITCSKLDFLFASPGARSSKKSKWPPKKKSKFQQNKNRSIWLTLESLSVLSVMDLDLGYFFLCQTIVLSTGDWDVFSRGLWKPTQIVDVEQTDKLRFFNFDLSFWEQTAYQNWYVCLYFHGFDFSIFWFLETSP